MMGKKKKSVAKKQDADESSDSGAAHENGAVASGCNHIAKAVDLGSLKRKLKLGLASGCHDCSKSGKTSNAAEVLISDSSTDIGSNVGSWLCLKCGHVGCGRTQKKHAHEHFLCPRSDIHAVVVCIDSWTVWCYSCEGKMAFNSTKKLQECVDYVRRHLQSAPLSAQLDDQVVSPSDDHGRSALNAPTQEPSSEIITAAGTEGGKSTVKDLRIKKKCLRVRGLVNLGNTCFYNSVLQCLSVTPYLSTVLERLVEKGENFYLPGNPNSKEVEIPPVSGELGESGPLTKALLSLLGDMRSSSHPADTLSPTQLLKHVQDRYPLFEGHEQHDAHELLRHLLEGVRADDLKRYKRVILKQCGRTSEVDESTRKKCKFYGKHLQELTLGVEGIFKGQLVSTLECQVCLNLSVRFENFLDLSLPVAEDKPLPPMRKKENHDAFGNGVPSKYQLKKQKKETIRSRKLQRARRLGSGSPDNSLSIPEENTNRQDGEASAQSDADVEDNAEQDSVLNGLGKEVEESGYSSEKQQTGDSVQTSPSIMCVDAEKNQNNSGARVDDCAWEEYYTPVHSSRNDKQPGSVGVDDIVSSQFHTPEHLCVDGHCNEKQNNEYVGVRHGCNTPVDEQLSITIPHGSGEMSLRMSPVRDRPTTTADEANHDDGKPGSVPHLETRLLSLCLKQNDADETDESQLNGIGSHDVIVGKSDLENISTQSDACINKKDIDGWRKTLAPKQPTEDRECSIISCLNQFTSLELMTGFNKVGCDACTQRQNKGKEGKTVYTNSTKQFLISLPPPVLILHLKRFMMENFRFRKLQRYVSFPLELDIASFCSNKCKDLPSISIDQTEVRYSLFGVVEHTGSLNAGHYVAYIKIRPALGESDPRWTFVPHTRDFVYPKVRSSKDGAVGVLDEKWYSISDSRAVETSETKVLKTQAYLLFYERIV